MRPKSYASSTIGVKKSTVATIARSGVNWYTAASSRVEASTRMRGSEIVGTWRKTCANSAGPSLQAQPAPCESAVSRTVVIGSAKIAGLPLRCSEPRRAVRARTGVGAGERQRAATSRAGAGMRPAGRRAETAATNPPVPSVSNQSDANSVTTAASTSRQKISQRLNDQTSARWSDGRAPPAPPPQRYPSGGATANSAATGSHARMSRPSVTLPVVPRPPEAAARTRARELALLQYHLAVHQDVLDADGRLVRLLERRVIHDRRGIEDGDVGEHPGTHETPIGEAHPLRRERRHLAYRELERKQLQVAGIVAEDSRECAVGAGVRGLRAQWPVGRVAAEVGVDRDPPLFHRQHRLRRRRARRAIGHAVR